MKAILARFTVALSLLATMALCPRRRGQVGLVELNVNNCSWLTLDPEPKRRDPARTPVTAGAEPSWTVAVPSRQHEERPILGRSSLSAWRPRHA